MFCSIVVSPRPVCMEEHVLWGSASVRMGTGVICVNLQVSNCMAAHMCMTVVAMTIDKIMLAVVAKTIFREKKGKIF